MSNGILDKEEWKTLKPLSKILGHEFATDDLGTDENEANLMLIYCAEIRYLLKIGKGGSQGFAALREYFLENQASKDF